MNYLALSVCTSWNKNIRWLFPADSSRKKELAHLSSVFDNWFVQIYVSAVLVGYVYDPFYFAAHLQSSIIKYVGWSGDSPWCNSSVSYFFGDWWLCFVFAAFDGENDSLKHKAFSHGQHFVWWHPLEVNFAVGISMIMRRSENSSCSETLRRFKCFILHFCIISPIDGSVFDYGPNLYLDNR